MRAYCLIFFLAMSTAKLHEEVTTTCIMNTDIYWHIFAAHFSEATLVTINILHVDKYHNIMAAFVDLVIKYVNVFTKLEKSICVKHTHLSVKQESDEILPHIAGKKAYVIIVWDHSILLDFLNVVPEEVVEDRRGKYVILFAYSVPQVCYDFYRFSAQVLARFWKEFGIVNVCSHIPCSCHADKIYQYHPFLRRINVFNVTDLNRNASTLTVSLRNLHQYPLKVSMFERHPTAIYVVNKTLSNLTYIGVDGFIMKTLAEVLNFRPVYLKTNYFKYGRLLKNGTAIGSLGDVMYRRVHIAGNGRFISDNEINRVEFSTPYQNDYVCFVVPKAQKIPQWIMIFHCFTPLSWLTYFTVFTIASLIWKVLRGNFFAFYAIFINNSTTLNLLTQKQKFFLIFCLLYNLIINGIFQGSFTTSFSTISYYPDIISLEGLANSGLIISSNVKVFKGNNNSLAKMLKKKQRPTYGNWALQRAALQRDVAAIERRLDAKYHIDKHFLDENGLPLVHIVEECLYSRFIAFIVPKGSPFLDEFNAVIKILVESGLPKKWYEDIAKSTISRSRTINMRFRDDKKVLILRDVQTAFYTLLVGLSFAFCVFLYELWQKKKENLQFLP